MNASTFILGGYQTDFSKVWSRQGQDISDMMREATLGALEKAQLAPSDIHSIHVGNAFAELQRNQAHLGSMVSQVVPELLGVPAMRHEGACASSSLAILTAMAEIESGRYDCVLVLGTEELKNLPGDVSSTNQNAAAWQGHEGIDCKFMWPAAFGLIAAEYERRYGLDRKYLNRISEINYGNAKRNPNAQTRKWRFEADSFTDDDEANPVIEPGTRRQDCGQITDGACAVILASQRFSEDYCRKRNVPQNKLSTVLGWGHHNNSLRLLEKLERSRDEPLVVPTVSQTIQDAWRRAGIASHAQLDGIETHDCFSVTEYLAIDHFGLTAPGESWKAVEDGSIEFKGRIPINASGGLIGGGHPVGATGARMLLDASKQVTDCAGDYQIEGAKTIGTLNIGGSCGTIVSFVVGVRDS
ncbi:MAG: thiolase domain-containing protein [Betaproteobacteria bacterium]|nr:thiolase domain-containing protein [Betaproteobacteria bacterium]